MKSDGETSNEKIRVKIYIDGPNFHFGLKSLKNSYQDFRFDFKKFGEKVASGRNLIDINYYTAPFFRKKDEVMYKKQFNFFKRLKADGIKVMICDYNPEKQVVKGDDIRLAVDMLDDAVRDVYDIGILISGDGDFKPLVDKIHTWKKKAELHYFTSRTSDKLLNSCDFHNKISRSRIVKYGFGKN